MIATKNGKTESAGLLLDKGANADLQRSDGVTALMVASINGQTDIVSLLLDKGANPELKTSEGKTAADYAGNPDIKSLLDNASAQVSKPVL
jgi:ankyrin repeat protein